MRSPFWFLLLPFGMLPTGACSPSKSIPVDEGGPQVVTLAPDTGQPMQVLGISTIAPGQYQVSPVAGEEELGILRLSNLVDITLDLQGVSFNGRADSEATGPAAPKGPAIGRGIVLENCENVTLIGGEWSGYATAITARHCRGLRIRAAEIQDFWSQELESTVTRDSGTDWLHPEVFLSEGWGGLSAAIELEDCHDVIIQNCKVRKGAIGLVTHSSSETILLSNDFSFLSAYGIVVAGGRDNTVAHNSLEYNVRGYSHGNYASGQNSAGILVVGAAQGSLLAFNRLTHCGSGVLLYGEELEAPIHTRLYGNDCQHSIWAGVQARNTRGTLIQNNELSHARHFGFYSEADIEIVLLNNSIQEVDGPGVGLFSSSKGALLQNKILRNRVGLEIAWAMSGANHSPLAGVSKAHHVLANTFENNGQDLVARDSQALVFASNQFRGENQRLHVDRIQAWMDPGADPAGRPQQDTVIGWLAGLNGVMPTGNLSGVSLKLWDGEIPGPLQVAQSLDAPHITGFSENPERAASEYRGGLETVVLGMYGPWDFPSGESQIQMRQPGGLFGSVRWQARWFAFDPETQDPRGDIAVWRAQGENAILRRTVEHFLDPRPGEEAQGVVPPVRFGLMADGVLMVPKSGTYRLSVTADDGIRLWVGDDVVFEDWTWNATRREGTLLQLEKGTIPVRLEYFQLDGASELVLELHHAR